MEEEQKNTPNMKLAKPGDYYVTLKFTWDNLQLDSGPMRDIYSIIYGFSQDGESACACNLKFFMNWTGASERTVRYIIEALEEAGYITRRKVGHGRKSYTEYRTNLEIVEECRKGAKFAAIQIPAKRSNNSGKMKQKRVQNLPLFTPITSARDNNIIIIYNNIFLPRMRAEDARRKENIIEFFFWKNAAKPLVEAEGFLRSAELSEWKDSKGRELNTQKKVLAWADGWEIRNGAGRTDSKFLKFWNVLYAWLLAEKDPMAARLLDSRIRGTITEESVTIALPEDLMNWIEGTIAKLPAEDPKRALFAAFIHGKKLSYEPFVL